MTTTTITDLSGVKRLEEIWQVTQLIPYERNAKKHDPKQVAKIAESIKQHGWTTRIVVDGDGVIIAGHGRRLAAMSIDPKCKVPVLVLDGISKEQAAALRLIDNKVQEGGYDTDLLSLELKELHTDLGLDMSKFFDERDLQFAIEDLGEIDLGSLSDDISFEVAEQTERTQNQIVEADTKMVPLAKVLGFSQVTGEQGRLIKRLVNTIENETGLQGADALAAFAREFDGEAA